MPLHYVRIRRLTVVSLLVCTNTYGRSLMVDGSDMYYNYNIGKSSGSRKP